MGGVGVSRLLRGDLGKGASDVSSEVISDIDGFVCPCERCGRVFSEPVRLTDFSRRPQEETYYACPFCFSRLNIDGILGDSKSLDGVFASTIKGNTIEKLGGEKIAVVSNCPRQFGYLRSRSKGSEIPDECLTCPKILQCMVST